MLKRFVDSLWRRVETDLKEWRSTSHTRKAFAYTRVQSLVLGASQRPLHSNSVVLLIVVVLSALVWIVAYQSEVQEPDANRPSDPVSYLVALWGVQASVSALVYPIVIGFVALLFQHRQNAKAILHVYLHDTGALLAGLSSLVLIAVIGTHHILLHQANAAVALLWSAIDSVWFLVNMLLTTFFLVRTFEFLLPDKRVHIIQRYAVNVAWPNELRTHLSQAFFTTAVYSKWLPGEPFGNSDGAHPKILLGTAGHGMGSEAVSMRVGRNVALVDVRLRPLRWATHVWLRRAKTTRINVPGTAHETPVLVFPLTPGARYTNNAILCRVVGDVPLSRISKWLIKRSFRFGRIRTRRFNLSVLAILTEMEADVREAISGNDVISYEEKLDELRDMYALLVRASNFRDAEGRDDNYTRVSDSGHWFSNPVFMSWSRVILNVFDPASEALDVRPDYIRRLSYVPVRLFSNLLEHGHEDILVHMVRLPPMLQRRTGDWWQRTLQKQGVSEHSPCIRQQLELPPRATYDSQLIQLVSAWSSLKDRFPPRRGETPTWDELRNPALYFQTHLVETLKMLLGSVLRGDQASAEWWCDVLLKWWDHLRHRFDRGSQFARQEKLVTIELTKRTWDEVRHEADVQVFRVAEQAPRGLFSVCLRNLWVDACCVAMYLLVDWGRDCECERSLAGHVLRALLTGKHFKAGGTVAGDNRPISSPSDLLVAFVRQNYGAGGRAGSYRATLNGWIEETARLTESEKVSGWIYGGWGRNDLDSLRAAQIALLSFLVTDRWDPIRHVDEILRRWIREDEARLRDLRFDMEQWANLVISGDMSRYSKVFDCYKAHAEKPQFDDALETILDASDTIIGRIEDIRSEALRSTPVADARLREVGRWASRIAFTKDTAAFPVVMFKDVRATDLEGQRRDFVLQHCDKGEFTQPVMAQLPINEDEWYSETIKHQVAGFVMADILRQLRLETVDGGTPDQYWARVKRFRDRTVAEGRRPVLLVENPTVPEWIWEWSLTEWEKDRELPHGLALTRSAEFAEIEDYMGNFGDVAVFNAPIAPGASYLLSDAVFERIDFTRHGDSFVRVTWEPVENEGRLIDVTLSWYFKLYLHDLAAVKLAYGQRDSH